MSTATSGDLIFEGLDRQLQQAETGREGVWAHLKETSNISNYQPRQAPGVVYEQLESQRDGTYYMLNNPQAGTYLRLDGRDFYIWSLMDGTQTIKQLVVAYFSEYGSIAFGRVTDLVAQLRAASFLNDAPVNVYAEASRQSHKGTITDWGERLVRVFLQKEMAISGLDGILTVLYRRIVWIFYSKPALVIYPLIFFAGLGVFLWTVQAEKYPLLNTAGKWYWGLLTLAGVNLFLVGIHESAHAFTVKHFRRRVRRGGFLIYFGSPACFIDTMDIWMEPKQSRLAVSWAGPLSGVIVASLATFALLGTGFSDALVNEILFKLALWGFVFGGLMNLNPLLEWDGYYMLMDWLELPNLRKRSMDFVKRNLLNKIVSRASFSREEKIFAVFGVMALVYTVMVIGVALFFWQSRVSSVLGYAGGWVFWLLIGLIAVVIGIPVALALGVLGYKVALRTKLWAYERFLKGRQANQVLALTVPAVVLALPAFLLGDKSSGIYAAVAGGLVLVAGVYLSAKVAQGYLRSQLQWFFVGLPILIVLLLVGRVLVPFEGAPGSIGSSIVHVTPLALLLGLALLSPTVISFTRTVLQGGWGLLVVGVGFLLIGGLVAVITTGDGADNYIHGLDLLGYGILGVSLFRVYQKLQSLRLKQPSGGVISEAISDVERLSFATRFLVEGALELFVQIYGRRALGALEKQFNAASAMSTSLGLSIRNGRVADTGQGTLLERSQMYRSALSQLFSINSRIAGRRFVEREAQSLYGLMPWELREVGDEHLFRHLDWMSGVRSAVASRKGSYAGLLRSAPLFTGLGEEDIKAISDRLRPEFYSDLNPIPRGKT